MYNRDLTKILESGLPKAGPYSDTVFSSKVRLIRNSHGIPFSRRQAEDNIKSIKDICEKFISDSGLKDLELVCLNLLDSNSRRFLRERNLISSRMENSENSYIILGPGEDFVILINDEDHFKIQVIKPGLSLREAYSRADEIDNELNKFSIYAFSKKMGYITSNPSGGGMEISATLHLPILYITKRMTEVQDIVKLTRLIIEGMKEEGLKTIGGLFVLSDIYTARIPETEILDETERIALKIVNLESEARESYISEHGIRLSDRISRSYGILRNARRMGYVESIDLLSDLRLGIILSIIKNTTLQRINDLIINMQWSHMQKIAGRIFNDTFEGDIFRASYLREQLEWSTIYG